MAPDARDPSMVGSTSLENTMRAWHGATRATRSDLQAVQTALKGDEMTRPVRYALIAICVLALYYLLYTLSRSLQ